MTNKTKCDSCNEEVKLDEWSSYTSDDNAKWCIDCGDDIHNDFVAECKLDWQEYKATCEEEDQ